MSRVEAAFTEAELGRSCAARMRRPIAAQFEYPNFGRCARRKKKRGVRA